VYPEFEGLRTEALIQVFIFSDIDADPAGCGATILPVAVDPTQRLVLNRGYGGVAARRCPAIRTHLEEANVKSHAVTACIPFVPSPAFQRAGSSLMSPIRG
jgi:hypothetical protein